jgi:hypothetical protein
MQTIGCRWVRAWALLWLAASTSGCTSFAAMGGPHTPNRGEVEIAGSYSLGGSANTANQQTINFTLEGAARYSLLDRYQLGLRLGLTGDTPTIRFEQKIGIFRVPDGEEGFEFSLAPSVGLIWFNEYGDGPSIAAQLGLMFGYRTLNGHEFYFSLEPSALKVDGPLGGTFWEFEPAGTAGVVVAIMPGMKLNLEWDMFRTRPISSGTASVGMNVMIGLLVQPFDMNQKHP